MLSVPIKRKGCLKGGPFAFYNSRMEWREITVAFLLLRDRLFFGLLRQLC
ncbi:MAG: hypothetical protein K4305_03165 [Chlorobium sp.]